MCVDQVVPKQTNKVNPRMYTTVLGFSFLRYNIADQRNKLAYLMSASNKVLIDICWKSHFIVREADRLQISLN